MDISTAYDHQEHWKMNVGFMFTAFNLRRLMNIIDKNVLKEFLKELVLLFFYQYHRIKCIYSYCIQPYFLFNFSRLPKKASL